MQRRRILAAAFSALTLATATPAAAAPERQLLLAIDFPARPVRMVDIGYFRFLPGQPAPIHTHAAPVIGYVVRGTILYQVEGQPVQVLKPGDAFHEPAGPRILRFDNASSREEAVFVDFNLQQEGEPFIVFPTPPTTPIDRRALPTLPLGDITVSRAEAYAETLGGRAATATLERPVVGYVVAGPVTLRVAGKPAQRIATGGAFLRPAGVATSLAAAEKSARVVTYELR